MHIFALDSHLTLSKIAFLSVSSSIMAAFMICYHAWYLMGSMTVSWLFCIIVVGNNEFDFQAKIHQNSSVSSCRYLINYVKVLGEMWCRLYLTRRKDLVVVQMKTRDSGFGDLLQIRLWLLHFQISLIGWYCLISSFILLNFVFLLGSLTILTCSFFHFISSGNHFVHLYHCA